MRAAGVALLISPPEFSRIWPWDIPPLTGRLLGVWLCAGAAAYAWTLWDGDWRRARPLFLAAPFTGLLLALIPLLHPGDVRPDAAGELLVYYALAAVIAAPGLGLLARRTGAGAEGGGMSAPAQERVPVTAAPEPGPRPMTPGRPRRPRRDRERHLLARALAVRLPVRDRDAVRVDDPAAAHRRVPRRELLGLDHARRHLCARARLGPRSGVRRAVPDRRASSCSSSRSCTSTSSTWTTSPAGRGSCSTRSSRPPSSSCSCARAPHSPAPSPSARTRCRARCSRRSRRSASRSARSGRRSIIAPLDAASLWPWTVTPLTGRAIGTFVLAQGALALTVCRERDWGRVRPPMYQAAGARASSTSARSSRFCDTLDWDTPGAWLYLGAGARGAAAVGGTGPLRSRRAVS